MNFELKVITNFTHKGKSFLTNQTISQGELSEESILKLESFGVITKIITEAPTIELEIEAKELVQTPTETTETLQEVEVQKTEEEIKTKKGNK